MTSNITLRNSLNFCCSN